MTINELIKYCESNNISLDTHIAVRAKDDYLLTEEKVYIDSAYFGNCSDGGKWEKENIPKDEDGELDYDNAPELLIMDSCRG